MATEQQLLSVESSSSLKSAKSIDGDSSQGLMLHAQDTSYSRSQTPDTHDEKDYDDRSSDRLTLTRALVILSMAFLWISGQMPLSFYGGIQINVLRTIGGYSQYVWLGLGQLIPLAIVTPFVATLSDLFGRRNISLIAFGLIIIGNILCATAQAMSAFLAGTIFLAMGAGIAELTSIAVVAEIAPPKDRGLYVGLMVATVLPLCPAVLYAQLIDYASTWRWIGLLVGGWAAVGMILTAIFYWPPTTHAHHSRRELVRRIDWVGGFLSGAGLCLLLIGFSLPTSGYSWSNFRTLTTLIIGLCLGIVFAIWEWRFAKYPMFSARLKEKSPRVLAVILLICFVSGANFFAVLLYWPTQYQILYATDDPVSIGIGSLPVNFGLIFGTVVVALLISILKGNIRTLLIISTLVMIAFNGAMAIANQNNLTLLWVIVSIACIGVGATMVPVQIIATIICPDDLLATITAVTIVVRILGGCLGYAIYSNIFAAKFSDEATKHIIPVLMNMGIKDPKVITLIIETIRGGGFTGLQQIPGIETAAQVVTLTNIGKEALVNSFPIVYYASIGFGALSIIASFFLTGIEKHMKGGAAVKIG